MLGIICFTTHIALNTADEASIEVNKGLRRRDYENQTQISKLCAMVSLRINPERESLCINIIFLNMGRKYEMYSFYVQYLTYSYIICMF